MRNAVNRTSILMNLFYSLIYSHLIYAVVAWGNTYDSTLNHYLFYKKSSRIITFSSFSEHTNPIFAELHDLKCHDIVQYHTLLFMHGFYMVTFLMCSMISLNRPGNAIGIMLDQQPKVISTYHMQEPTMENLMFSSMV